MNSSDTELLSQIVAYAYVLVSSIMIIFMQVGFTLIECGTVRRKNASSIFVKSVYNIIFGIIVFWLFGFALGFSNNVDEFIGFRGGFFATYSLDTLDSNYYPVFIFYYAKAITCSIVA